MCEEQGVADVTVSNGQRWDQTRVMSSDQDEGIMMDRLPRVGVLGKEAMVSDGASSA